jgi:hypothetical protein
MEPEHPLFEAFVRGVGGAALGACVGAASLGIGLLRAAVAVIGGTHVQMDWLWPPAGLYVLGFAAGGPVMGALWPNQPGRARRYLAGAVGGMVTTGAIAQIADGPRALSSPSALIFVLVAGPLFGMAFTGGFLGPPAA